MTPTERLKSRPRSPGNMEQEARMPPSGLASGWLRLERSQLPSNWHYMLPEPKRYFGNRVAELRKPNATGWAQGKCPFHDDPAAAFNVNLKWDQPRWRCFGGCGEGSMVDFHMRMYRLDFAEAVAELLLGVA